MRSRALVLVLFAAALVAHPVHAADPPAAPPKAAAPVVDASQQVVRVFEVRYRDVTDVSVLIEPHLSPNALLAVNKRTNTVKVIDSPEVVRAIADFIAQFDVPPHAVIVRIVLEKAERAAPAGGDKAFSDITAWTYRHLAETTLEVLERGETRQAFGPDGAFEIHLALASVDPARELMQFDHVAVRKVDATLPATVTGKPAQRLLLDTSLQLQDGVGKMVMTASNESADVALVVRLTGLVGDRQATGGR